MKKQSVVGAGVMALCALPGSANAVLIVLTGLALDAVASAATYAAHADGHVRAQEALDAGPSARANSTFTVFGKSHDLSSGAITPDLSNVTSRMLLFDSLQTGSVSLTLEAAESFSNYLLDDGTTRFTGIQYRTAGPLAKSNGQSDGYLHGSLSDTSGAGTSTPWLQAYVVVLACLGAMGFTARRRKRR